jgi:hypothetical protein
MLRYNIEDLRSWRLVNCLYGNDVMTGNYIGHIILSFSEESVFLLYQSKKNCKQCSYLYDWVGLA